VFNRSPYRDKEVVVIIKTVAALQTQANVSTLVLFTTYNAQELSFRLEIKTNKHFIAKFEPEFILINADSQSLGNITRKYGRNQFSYNSFH
jgi:hypothetical protein